MKHPQAQQLTSGKLLARNTIYSLIGQGIPLLLAVFSIPLLIKGLGTDRFGILTLAWMIISYFSLFDLGLGRALTQLVAERLGKGEDEETIADLVWTASILMVGLGAVGAIVFIAIAPWLVYTVLKLPEAIQQETLNSFYWLSISIPIVTCSAGLVGVLSALQRFDMINAVRIPLGLFMFMGPLVVLPVSNSLVPIMAVLVVGRLTFAGFYAWCCFRAMPALATRARFSQSSVFPLLRFGSWMTVTNIVGPLMVSMDRFLIGSLISVTAVTYYTTPYEVVTKLWIIPTALVSVLFPAFSTSFANNPKQAARLFNQGVRYIFLVLYPITFIVVAFASEGLNIWLGKDFAANSAPVLQWLAIGILINSLAQVPFALIQSLARPDITAKLHMLELPFYAILLWQFTHLFGIVGAAYAWVIRVLVDTVFTFHIAHSFLPNYSSIIRSTILILGGVVFTFPLITLSTTGILKMSLVSLVLLGFAAIAWCILLTIEERKWITKQLRLIHI
jgi:O-antigen/teichoic acid export membrane protein